MQIPQLLNSKDKTLWELFGQIVSDNGYDKQKIFEITHTTKKYLSGNQSVRASMAGAQELEQRWYASLNSGKPDYSVYESDWYLAELWACWSVYSRKYLRGLYCSGIIEELSDVNTVVDLGCGLGVSTAALKQMFPRATVIGTNVSGTAQFKFAEIIGEKFSFEVAGEIPELVGGSGVLVFASEFFEHIPDPLEYLASTISLMKPGRLLIANSFNTRAIGHFINYRIDGEDIGGDQVPRIFNRALKNSGYEKIKTTFWNQRPTYWKAI